MMVLMGAFLAAYLAGSIPFGLLVGYAVKGIDIRKHGSGNLGATNVFRVVGKKWGIGVLFLDALKGYLVLVGLVHWLTELGPYTQLGLGVTAILGHVFPIWLRFKGGKGVATSLGVFLALIPGPALVTFGVWIAVFVLSRIISLASLAAALFFPGVIFVMMAGTPARSAYLGISLLLAGFIFFTHRANVGRLCKKEEKRII